MPPQSNTPYYYQKSSMFKGTFPFAVHQIRLKEISVEDDLSISPEDVKFPASYDIVKDGIIVPGSCPVWKENPLPVQLSPDRPHTPWRAILPRCALLPVFGALPEDSETAPHTFDLVTERKNLWKLLDFVEGKSVKYRIDAEVIGKTMLFYDSWVHNQILAGYTVPNTFGRSFERHFTQTFSEDFIEHGRIATYTFGGLRVMVKYTAEACLHAPPEEKLGVENSPERNPIRRVGGMNVKTNPRQYIPPGADMLEIKTTRVGKAVKTNTMGQLWFSQTPRLYHGLHNGEGMFVKVDQLNLVEDGSMKAWEEKEANSLRKIAKLVGMIKDGLDKIEGKKAGLIFVKEKDTNEPVVEFRRFTISYKPNALPAEVKETWFS